MNWLPLVIIALLGLLALVPARRLQLQGWSQGTALAYGLLVWFIAASLLVSRGTGARFLVPLLLVLWIWPFVTWREGLDRLLGRTKAREPRNVTPAEASEVPGTLEGSAVRLRDVSVPTQAADPVATDPERPGTP